MNPKQKAVENVKSYLDKRVEKNNHKLLDYRDREKVYGLRYEDKKDVIHAENEFIDNLLRGDAATQFNDDRLEKLQSKVNRLLGELDELQAYRMVERRFIEIESKPEETPMDEAIQKEEPLQQPLSNQVHEEVCKEEPEVEPTLVEKYQAFKSTINMAEFNDLVDLVTADTKKMRELMAKSMQTIANDCGLKA